MVAEQRNKALQMEMQLKTMQSYKLSTKSRVSLEKYTKCKDKYSAYLGYQSKNIVSELTVRLNSKMKELESVKKMMEAQAKSNEELLVMEQSLSTKYAKNYLKMNDEIKELLQKNNQLREERQRNLIEMSKKEKENKEQLNKAVQQGEVKEKEYDLLVKTLERIEKKEVVKEEIVVDPVENVIKRLEKAKIINLKDDSKPEEPQKIKEEPKKQGIPSKKPQNTVEDKPKKEIKKEQSENQEDTKKKPIQKIKRQTQASSRPKRDTVSAIKIPQEKEYSRPKRDWVPQEKEDSIDEFELNKEESVKITTLNTEARTKAAAKLFKEVERLSKKHKPGSNIYTANTYKPPEDYINEAMCLEIASNSDYNLAEHNLLQLQQILCFLLNSSNSPNLTELDLLDSANARSIEFDSSLSEEAAALLPLFCTHLKKVIAEKKTNMVFACNYLVNSFANFDLTEKTKLKLRSIIEKKLSGSANKANTFGKALVTSEYLNRFR